MYDSGQDLEEITAKVLPAEFNSTHEENGTFDNRSDNKGPEPEGVVLGRVGLRTYAFVGLERIGGVMVFDVTSPWRVEFETYVNPRDFMGDPEGGTAGDLGPEGLHFVPAWQSPTWKPPPPRRQRGQRHDDDVRSDPPLNATRCARRPV